MDKQGIALQRIHSQGIAAPHFTTAGEVVSWLGAIQGQDYAGAKWSLGLRVPGSTDTDSERAIVDKTIVRTWVMRGTLHLVAATDVRWLVALLGQRLIASSARRYRELELDETTLSRSTTLLIEALADGRQHSRGDLFEMLQRNGISTAGQRGIHMLRHASMHGLICQGVAVRNDPTFMALDENVPQGTNLNREEAIVELAKRYFTSRAPVTLKDFITWSGLPTSDARAGLEAIKSQLMSETIDGQTYWMPQQMPPISDAARTVYLLPGFDEYLLGYGDRTAVLDPQYNNRIVPGGNGIFYPTIVSNGRVVGTWKRTLKKNTVIITPQPFEGLSEVEMEGIEEAARQYGAFLGISTVLS